MATLLRDLRILQFTLLHLKLIWIEWEVEILPNTAFDKVSWIIQRFLFLDIKISLRTVKILTFLQILRLFFFETVLLLDIEPILSFVLKLFTDIEFEFLLSPADNDWMAKFNFVQLIIWHFLLIIQYLDILRILSSNLNIYASIEPVRWSCIWPG